MQVLGKCLGRMRQVGMQDGEEGGQQAEADRLRLSVASW